jgi:hypothetical protein
MPCRMGFIIFLHNNTLHWWLQYYLSLDRSCHNVEKLNKSWKAFTCSNHWLKAQGCYFMSVRTWPVIKWAWTNFFWNILLMSTKYLKNILWHIQNIWWHGRIFCHVFVDEWYLWMKMWMIIENGWTFSWMLSIFFFCEKLNKKIGWNFFMLVYFEKFNIWNVEVMFQIIFFINLIWNLLSFAASKPYRILN